MSRDDLTWHRVADLDELPEGRVKTVVAGVKTICLSHFDGQFAAMDNHCPHQGGPLGEGSIETGADGQCWIRCPWHGWDFDPLTGTPPGGHEDAGQELFEVDIREDGIYLGLPKEPEAATTVSNIMAKTMTNWGVRNVFGMVGHSNLGLADAIRREEVDGNLRYFGIRHEGAAAFACSGYAKLTGMPAACLTIAGPGATNLLTGLWDAKVDRAPVLALTGQIDTQVIGAGAFQEIDLMSAFQAVSNFSQTVLPTSNHPELMNLALKHAHVERGVSHLIFPDEVQVTDAREKQRPGQMEGRLASHVIEPNEAVLDRAIGKISSASKPLIIVGYGARSGMDEIIALAERLKCPVVTTFKAKGQIADSHPNAAGVLGRSGTPIASWFMNECDLQIVFGASFSNHTGIERSKPTIQVDFDRMALGKFHAVEIPMWGEVSETARLIGENLPPAIRAEDQLPELISRWSIWRKEKGNRWNDDLGKGMNSAWLFHVLSEIAPEDAVLPVDVGNNTYSFGRYFETKPGQRVLMSGYLGSIGFSFPAAMGAWCATTEDGPFKGRTVISISGDGGFGQYLADFNTAVKYGMNITHILLNNSELGKISKEQMAAEWQVWQTSLHNPSFSAYAKLCGGQGWKVSKPDQLGAAIRAALDFNGPAIVEVMTDASLI